MGVSPNDHLYAQAISGTAPAFNLFDFFRAQLERIAADKFALEQFEARDAWLANETERLTVLYRLAEEFAPEQLADLVAYLSWRVVYLVRREDGVYTLHPTVQ